MIKFLKSNKFTVILILFICFVFATNPMVYSASCLNAISVWAIKIFPVMFPFFVFTRIIVNFSENKPGFMDKFFNKLYHTPAGSFKTFFLATLSGYPMGAKLICVQYQENKITSIDAAKMLSFCSVSGPMFMLGTVGVSIFCSYKAGLIILISNILASLINGVLYRGKKNEIKHTLYTAKKTNLKLGEQVNDSVNSILMVGAYIVLSFLIIDILKNLNVITFISKFITNIFSIQDKQNVVSSILCGLLEITRGIIELNSTQESLFIKTIIASFLIGFGGFSVFIQNLHFLEKLNIKKRIIFNQKFTQALLALLMSFIICSLFL